MKILRTVKSRPAAVVVSSLHLGDVFAFEEDLAGDDPMLVVGHGFGEIGEEVLVFDLGRNRHFTVAINRKVHKLEAVVQILV